MEQPLLKKTSADYMRVVQLMKEIGSKDGFEPIPWTQIAWHMAEGQPLLNRLWGWLASKTLRKGHWSAYAIDVARDAAVIELHLENAAAALKADEANVRREWRKGLERGYWRNGTEKEGVRRLYICGNVPPAQENAENSVTEVCTDLLPHPILKQIKEREKDWPPERVAHLRAWYEQRLSVRSTVLADVVAVARNILDQEDDTGLCAWGLQPTRNKEHASPVPPEARDARKVRIAPLLPEIQRYVQTATTFVQSSDFALYNGRSGHVQTSATLLSETNPRQQLDGQAGGNSDAVSRASGAPHPVDSRERKQLPVRETGKSGQTVEREPEKLATEDQQGYELRFLATEDQQAYDLLFSEIERMQHANKRTAFAFEPIDRKNRGDQVTVRRILATVGRENVPAYLLFVLGKFKGLDRNALGKRPARAPGRDSGPRSLGLLVMWAEDWARNRRAKGAGNA